MGFAHAGILDRVSAILGLAERDIPGCVRAILAFRAPQNVESGLVIFGIGGRYHSATGARSFGISARRDSGIGACRFRLWCGAPFGKGCVQFWDFSTAPFRNACLHLLALLRCSICWAMVLESAISNAGFQGSKAPLAGAYVPLAGPGMASLAHTLLLQRTSAPSPSAAGRPDHLPACAKRLRQTHQAPARIWHRTEIPEIKEKATK